ncbi:MAG: hypothetical protein NVS3B10_03430 [Polyangiales bacterium]
MAYFQLAQLEATLVLTAGLISCSATTPRTEQGALGSEAGLDATADGAAADAAPESPVEDLPDGAIVDPTKCRSYGPDTYGVCSAHRPTVWGCPGVVRPAKDCNATALTGFVGYEHVYCCAP